MGQPLLTEFLGQASEVVRGREFFFFFFHGILGPKPAAAATSAPELLSHSHGHLSLEIPHVLACPLSSRPYLPGDVPSTSSIVLDYANQDCPLLLGVCS